MTAKADVRDLAGLRDALQRGIDELGRPDVVIANAGISGSPASSAMLEEDAWQTMIDINLTGSGTPRKWRCRRFPTGAAARSSWSARCWDSRRRVHGPLRPITTTRTRTTIRKDCAGDLRRCSRRIRTTRWTASTASWNPAPTVSAPSSSACWSWRSPRSRRSSSWRSPGRSRWPPTPFTTFPTRSPPCRRGSYLR